jgi:hypothetical protein
MTTHQEVQDRLSEYVDGELDAMERETVEAHLANCEACRTITDGLRQVVRRAGRLEDSLPQADLWPGVTERIRAPAPEALPFRRVPRTFSFTLPQLVAAGLALMVLSGSMVWLARLGGERTDFPPVAAEAPPPQVTAVSFADEQYDRAIADLMETLDAERTRLDPRTVQVLEENLQAIDAAIEQCRRALAEDPANAFLNVHLADARMRKLALLREVTALAGS